MSFSKEQTEELKIKLLEEKKRILSHLKSAKKSSGFGGGAEDPEDEADETEEFANYLGVEQIEENSIHEIDVALDKMTDGSYGICEQCDQDISYELLSIQPESKLCKQCKLAGK
ncbi:MAG: TraR/DksA C4-type zinc finger protein [Candidatus Paceibacterota bacterium]|jgi:DnaK suppressor protein